VVYIDEDVEQIEKWEHDDFYSRNRGRLNTKNTTGVLTLHRTFSSASSRSLYPVFYLPAFYLFSYLLSQSSLSRRL